MSVSVESVEEIDAALARRAERRFARQVERESARELLARALREREARSVVGRLRQRCLSVAPSGAVPDWTGLRTLGVELGVPGFKITGPAGVHPRRKEWGTIEAPEWLSVLEYLIERVNFVLAMKPGVYRPAEVIEPWRKAVLAWIAPHRPWILEAQELRASVYADVEREDRVAAAAAAELEREQAELLAAERAARVAKRALRVSRKRMLDYEAKRVDGVFQGFVEMKPGFFFGAAALHRPRWSYVLLGDDGALYVGSTFYLRRRIREHRDGAGSTVTAHTAQRWFLLHAERHATGQLANCVEAALLGSEVLQAALLARCVNRAVRLHKRHGCAVPWMGWSRR